MTIRIYKTLITFLIFGASPVMAQLVIRNSADNTVMKILTEGSVSLGGQSVSDPVEALDVKGAIRIGNTSKTNVGTIRWDGTNFLGRLASGWVNLNESQTLSLAGYTLSISQGNSIQLPRSIELYTVGSPRNVLITFNGEPVSGVYVKDGSPTGVTDPLANGWTLVSNWSDYIRYDNSAGAATGIIIPPNLSNCPADAQALSVRAGAFGGTSALFYLGYVAEAHLKQMGDTGSSGECNGLLILDTSRNFFLMSQKQRDGVPERRLTHLWVTIFGGIK